MVGSIVCPLLHTVSNAVHPFKVPVPIEGHLFLPIEDPSVMDSTHQHAVLFSEKRNNEVGMKTKYNSISMEEFPEISKKTWVASLPKEIKDREKIFPPSPTST
jgi:hypothetical protein